MYPEFLGKCYAYLGILEADNKKHIENKRKIKKAVHGDKKNIIKHILQQELN